MSDDSEKYWYNLETGEVEKGYESPAVDRAGPFDTAEEAAQRARDAAGALARVGRGRGPRRLLGRPRIGADTLDD